MEDYKPFFYIIRNKSNNMMYAGSRTTKTEQANPSQLLTSYFTSSTTVKAAMEVGDEFEIIKTRTFSSAETTLMFEMRFLRLYRCVKNEQWYNRHDGTTLAPFHSSKYQDMLFQKYGPGVTCSMHVPGISERVSDSLRGGINCWDEHLQQRRRVTTEEYHSHPDRFWHIQSLKYRNKYKGGKSLEKPSVQTHYNIYDNNNVCVFANVSRLKEFCDSNGMPHSAFRNSAWRGGERLYWTHIRPPKNKSFMKYRGWYAFLVKDDVGDPPKEPVWISKKG